MRSLFWIVVVIIVYGSFYPFNFIWTDLSQIEWLDWGTTIEHRTTNGDVLSNFLTFLPLGYFAFLYSRKSETSIYWRVSQILVLGFLFAYLLQIAQFFLPSRVPTVGDAVANLVGIFIGVMVAVWVETSLWRNPSFQQDRSLHFSAPLVLIACGLLYQLFPFFPGFSYDSIMHNLQPLWSEPIFVWHQWFFLSVFWGCFFLLLKDNPLQALTYRFSFLLVLVIFILKSLIAHNPVNLNAILGAIIGVLLAFKLPANYRIALILLLTASALLLREIQPWQAELPTTGFNWVPLSAYLKGSMWVNTQSFLEKLFVYGCLIHFANLYLKDTLKAFVSGLAFVISIELLQLLASAGRADITEPLIFIILAYALNQISCSASLGKNID